MSLKFANNNSLSAITALPAAVSSGALTLLQTQTASSSATISFTSNIDSTYDVYMFKFYDIHPSANGFFGFNASVDSGSNYNVTKTSSAFYAYHAESDSEADLTYDTGQDLAQSTGRQNLSSGQIGVGSDDSFNGCLYLFNPSSTTFVKHYISSSSYSQKGPANEQAYIAGYCNTTSAVNAIQFSQSTGNIDSGVIKLYGIS